MEVVRRIAAWGALVAVARCGLNTAEEERLGRDALQALRSMPEPSEESPPTHRVFGGFLTYIGLYPFAAFYILKWKEGAGSCSAAIIAPKWTLSAAHCVRRPGWQGVMFAGDVDYTNNIVFTKINIQIRVISEIFNYNPPQVDKLRHDIIVVKLWREFNIDATYVDVIPMTENETLPADFKEICVIVGFGQRSRDAQPKAGLQRGASFIMEPGPRCNRSDIKENGLCTLDVATKSACPGDSGGPIFCSSRFVLMATITGGRYENCSAMWCGAPIKHNFHMFIGYYRKWILSVMNPSGIERGQSPTTASASLTSIQLPVLSLLLLSSAINAYSTT